MSKEPVRIHIESELGEKLKNIKLGYFSTLIKIATRKMNDEEQDFVDECAQRVTEVIIDRLNTIEDARMRIAIGAIVVFNLATCMYLTIDEAVTAVEIEQTFGGGGDE
jgi:hypothetical protein